MALFKANNNCISNNNCKTVGFKTYISSSDSETCLPADEYYTLAENSLDKLLNWPANDELQPKLNKLQENELNISSNLSNNEEANLEFGKTSLPLNETELSIQSGGIIDERDPREPKRPITLEYSELLTDKIEKKFAQSSSIHENEKSSKDWEKEDTILKINDCDTMEKLTKYII
ncbi:hypothetical protein HCN44_008932 [Aphidius gifuensis]|uniref:Uncharacterized protein n=1 Tax=Aphidius gifuensis TaxID=684658 RepID=A0A834XVH3_APHGI|nr:hypothetical protein HCN44_008932 [Aphidius gifuensis]